jgi:hypothetical protein
MRSWFLVVVVVGVACSSARETEPAEPGVAPGPAPTPAPVPEVEPVAPVVDVCEAYIAEYAAALEARDDACARDADCACYQGGVGPAAGCGGVTGRATAVTLDAILARFQAAACDYTQQCAPWACEPRCVEGRCSR